MSSAAWAAASQAILPFHQHHHLRRCTPPALHLRPRGHPVLVILPSFLRRRRRRPPDPKPYPPRRDRSMDLSAPLDNAAASLARLRRNSESQLQRLLNDADDAYRDLRTSLRVDRGGRIVFSCRQSSLLFVANLFVFSLACIVLVRGLVWLWPGFRWRQWGFGGWEILRRDRSLGGREVVVGRRSRRREAMPGSFRVSVNPLSPAKGSVVATKENSIEKRGRKHGDLPKWWPEVSSSPATAVGKEEMQREANRLVRAITDYRMSGKDYRYDDIIQLYQLCKLSGAKVSFETANARDSFYRAAINFVLDICMRSIQATYKVEIDGEDCRIFVSALADNIGLENFRAITLVRAAVATRTRACFLQCWAFVVQGRRSEALEELLKICLVHRMFPPEENSPEMEMVASGLKKNLRTDEREHLLSLYKGVCDSDHHRSAAEALGLCS